MLLVLMWLLARAAYVRREVILDVLHVLFNLTAHRVKVVLEVLGIFELLLLCFEPLEL